MSKIAKFFSILAAELVDAKDELEGSIDKVRTAREKEACTEYVRRENEALYRSEVSAIRDFQREISLRETGEYASVDEAVAAVSSLIEDKVTLGNYPELMADFLRRKINNVWSFVEER